MTYTQETFSQDNHNGEFHPQENLTSERARQIQAIVKQRQQKAGKIKQVIQNWKNVYTALEEIQKKRKQLTNYHNFAQRLAQHNFTTTLKSIKSAIIELENLENRLSRNTLNAGVVGIMRNGKSELLQSITGLEKEHIPTSSKGVCTRGLSKIFHVSNPGEEQNEIEFHSWSSFKEIIHLYFDKLGLPNTDKPDVPDDMGNRPPNLPEARRQDVNARYLYGRLCREYYAKFNLYKKYLNGSTKVIPTKDISKYITYNEQTSNGEYLAVKELRVYCKFPYHEEVGQIGVIDLPGLGDDNIFDLERLIKTLKQGIDVILFVRMPKPITGDDWKEEDRTMFQTASKALGEFPLSECSFVILNRIQKNDEDTYELCQLFSQNFDKQNINIKHPPIIANCALPGEVKDKILTPVLDYLSGNIELVYQEYMRSCDKKLQMLQDNIRHQLAKAGEATTIEGEDLQFDYWFEQYMWPNLNNGLSQLLKNLNQNINKEDETFKVAVEQAVQNCLGEEIVPTVEQIESEKYKNHDSYKIIYLVYINEIKNQLRANFSSLGVELNNLLKQVQSSVVDVLRDKGNLKSLTDKKGNDFFKDIIDKIPHTTQNSNLKKGFHDIQDYSVAYDNMIIEWIKDHLDELQPDGNLDPISHKQTRLKNNPSPEKILNFIQSQKQSQPESDKEISNILGLAISNQVSTQIREVILNPVSASIQEKYQKAENDLEPTTNASDAELIAQELQTLREQIVTKCHNTLKQELSKPNKLAVNMVEKFLSQVLTPSVQIEWRTFLRKYQSQVWEGAKQKQDYEELEIGWQKLIKSAQEANNAEDLGLF